MAVSIPDLAAIVTLFGSFNAPLLAIILPPLMAIRLGIGGKARHLLHWAMIVCFTGLAFAGVGEAGYRIVDTYTGGKDPESSIGTG